MKKVIVSLLLITSFMGAAEPFGAFRVLSGEALSALAGTYGASKEQIMGLIERVEEGKADASILNKLPEDRWGLLGMQVRQRDLGLAEKLLQAGADPNFDDGVATPLDFARSKREMELLLEHGADPKKCKESLLDNIYRHYVVLREEKPASMSDEDWLKEGIETMDLVIKKGEDPHKMGLFGTHLLCHIAEGRDTAATKAFLSCVIRNGSNPNLPYFEEEDSVYACYLSSHEPLKHLVPFIRKERGWALFRQLLIATHERVEEKIQSSDCYIRNLPLEIVHIIGKMALGHPDPFGERQELKTPFECGANRTQM